MSHVQPGITDIATVSPSLVVEWDFEKNYPLTPGYISAHSNKKYWWKCKNNHSWQETPDKRSNGRSCPFCSGKRVLSGYNDLLTTCPELALDWDYEKNTDIRPDTLTSGSNKKVWWRCHVCHYSWITSPNSRKSGTRKCPQCAEIQRRSSFRKSFVRLGENDIQSQSPELMLEWDFDKNAEKDPSQYTINSKEKVWWICRQCGHSWNATINNRFRNQSGCPKCMKHKRTSFPEQAIFYYISQFYPDAENGYRNLLSNSLLEVDIYIPSINTGIEYDGIAWHNNDASRQRDKKKYDICTKLGIKLIRISEFLRNNNDSDIILYRKDNSDLSLSNVISEMMAVIGISTSDIDVQRDRAIIMQQYITYIAQKSIAIKYPSEIKYWDTEKNQGLTPDKVNAVSNVNYWWKCDFGHNYKAAPSNRLGTGNGCPYCSGHKVLIGFNDFATVHPELLTDWDYEKNFPTTPQDLTSGSTKQVWWKCINHHSYKASPNNKVYNHTPCPYCTNRAVLKGYNDLQTIWPNVSAKWDYSSNTLTPDQVLCNSHCVATWKCGLGHTWQRTISAEIKYDGCPVCNDQELLLGFNDIATKYPQLSSEWNYEKNTSSPQNFTRLSREKVWWCCSTCGNEWEAIIATRISAGTGCPRCGYSQKMQNTRLKNLQAAKGAFSDKYPELLPEWDFQKNEVNPTMISPGANIKIWWKCAMGHSYQAWLTDRTGRLKTGCPYCAGKRRLDNITETNPELIDEWDYDKNGDKRPEHYSKNNHTKIWWLCSKGHSFESTIGSRTSERHKNGCPYCANKKVLKGYNDLQTVFPKIASEWDYTKNGVLTPTDIVFGSAKKVWWLCSTCNFSYEKAVFYRTLSKSGCPECNRQRISHPVYCVEENKIYSSIKEAADITGISSNAISKAISGKQNMAGGFHWKSTK